MPTVPGLLQTTLFALVSSCLRIKPLPLFPQHLLPSVLFHCQTVLALGLYHASFLLSLEAIEPLPLRHSLLNESLPLRNCRLDQLLGISRALSCRELLSALLSQLEGLGFLDMIATNTLVVRLMGEAYAFRIVRRAD